MAVEIICQWDGRAFVPSDQAQAELAAMAARSGKEIKVAVSHPRNPKQHRLLMALLQIIANNHPTYDRLDKVLLALKLATGHAECSVVNETVVWTPKSISFAAMDQAEFNEFFDAALHHTTGWLLKGVTREQVLNEITQITGVDVRERKAA